MLYLLKLLLDLILTALVLGIEVKTLLLFEFNLIIEHVHLIAFPVILACHLLILSLVLIASSQQLLTILLLLRHLFLIGRDGRLPFFQELLHFRVLRFQL